MRDDYPEAEDTVSAEDIRPPPDREWERGHQSIKESHTHYHGNGNGNSKLNSIILGVATFALTVLLTIFSFQLQRVVDGLQNLSVRVAVLESKTK